MPEPSNPQAYDRFAYVNNNPVNGTDPTGHYILVNEEVGGLGVRYDNERNIVIVHGGSTFTNPVEVATANYLSTQNPIYLESLPENPPPKAFENAASGLGYTWDVDEMIANVINPISKSIDVIQDIGDVNIPVIGVFLDFSEQLARDSDANYSQLHSYARAGLVTVEGQVSSWFALTTAGSLGVLGSEAGPAAITFATAVYLTVDLTVSEMLDQANEQVFFPILEDLFGP